MLEPARASLSATLLATFPLPFPRPETAPIGEWRRRRRTGIRLQRHVKALADRVLAGLLLVALSPVLLTIALALALSERGPVFYWSPRIGRDYVPFSMLKFRTMRVDADAMREALRAQAQLQGELFKLADDPRVTRLGRFLRATSLDELPQLVNVLRGEMSLVGPRPLPPDESSLFQPPYTRRFDVLPGITGIWQVKGRSDACFQRLCELELGYIRHWSLWQDIRILLDTVPAVLLRRGAR